MLRRYLAEQAEMRDAGEFAEAATWLERAARMNPAIRG
jgi:hypothetical protein